MKFKMKGINTLINSPLAQTSSTGQKIENTDFTTNLAGEQIAIGRTITEPGSIESNTGVGFEESYSKLNDKQRKDFPDLQSWRKYVNDFNANKNATKTKQVRDYTTGLIKKVGPDGIITYYKSREDGGEDRAYLTGEFLEGRMNYGFDKGQWGKRQQGMGSGDKNKYLTKNEALQLFKDSRTYHVDRSDNRYYKEDMKEANSKKKLQADYDKWLTQQTGGGPEKLVYTKNFKGPTKYTKNENIGNWQNVNKNN